ncbi:MAG: glycosyltransferase family 2 protein [Magnetospirillum sp. WYHS-4]
MTAASDRIPPQLAVVVPVHDEADNLAPLIAEIRAALADVGPFEIVYVDDGSSDATWERLRTLKAQIPELRCLRHRACCGQSAAVATGVKAASAPIVATLDGDGQNDPADIPRLLEVLRLAPDPDLLLVAGHRTQRKDTPYKRLQSRVANRVRGGLLGDATPDTGCGLKVFTRTAFLDMPRFDHMHRYLPALMLRRGGRVQSVPVNHRPRARGVSKYGMLDRLMVGLVDLLGVMWLQRRGSKPQVEE